jgi:hypothetical protein
VPLKVIIVGLVYHLLDGKSEKKAESLIFLGRELGGWPQRSRWESEATMSTSLSSLLRSQKSEQVSSAHQT